MQIRRLAYTFHMVRAGNLTKGFTLVELLIVIVVIAILSSITVVAYNGVQDRAKTAVIYANAKQLANAVAIYGQETGTLPSQNYSCFGEAANFPSTSLNNTRYCWNIRYGSDVWNQASVHSTSSVSSQLSSVMDSTSFKYDLIQLSDTDGYEHAVRGFWYNSLGTAPYTQASVSFAIPSENCPDGSVEFVDDYYTNGNICSIEVSI